MAFNSLTFLAFAVAAIVLAHMSNGRAWRPWAMLALSLTFVSTAVAGWAQMLVLAGFCIFVFFATIAVDRGRSGWLFVAVTAEVALFVWLKQYTPVADLAPLPAAVGLAGLSYMFFRGIHLTVDVASGALKRQDPLAVVNYLLFFPTFISGPVERFEDIEPQLMRQGSVPDEAETFSAMVRVIFGCFKVTLVSSTILALHTSALTRSAPVDGAAAAQFFFLAAALYMIYLYVNFSGYMDIVISVARLMGIKISENFNHPFRAGSFLEIWSRWHITVSSWFRFYIFNPILKALTGRWPIPGIVPYFGVFAFFVTFLAMGMWHGGTAPFVIIGLGLALAFGVSGNRLYQVLMVRWLGRTKYAVLTSGSLYNAVARGIVFAYFSAAVSCLFMTGADFVGLCMRAGLWLLPGWLCLVLGAAILLGLWDMVEAVASAIARRIVAAPSLIRSTALAVVLGLFIFTQIWDSNPSPVFVYRGF